MNVFITGGTGFIGSNTAKHFLDLGNKVVVFDDLSRKGVEKNLTWLKREIASPLLSFVRGDIRNFDDVQHRVKTAFGATSESDEKNIIIHLAAQVAVTDSVSNPRKDFEVNALGTLNLLEAARLSKADPIVIFASTNKVYGGMEDVQIVEKETRYEYKDYPNGMSESRNLDFHSPYGCSKGSADQYIRDYARIYNMKTVVFRNSCIYGPRQFGNEDQGWIAHFIISSVFERPISIYGDGKQVRDVLFINDLVRAFELAVDNIDVTAGQVYNIGGGKDNAISIWVEFSKILEKLLGRELPISYGEWRPGDQLVYISDIAKAGKDFGWQPKVDPEHGIEILYNWVASHKHLMDK